jgi:hypothetical protein
VGLERRSIIKPSNEIMSTISTTPNEAAHENAQRHRQLSCQPNGSGH